MINPLKIIWTGIKKGGEGARFAYRQMKRPEVMAFLQIGGMFIPGLNALGILKFITFAKNAEMTFSSPGSGKQKLQWVLGQAVSLKPHLEAMGVPKSDWGTYIEASLLIIKGQAKLRSEVDGRTLLEKDMMKLAALFDKAA